MADWQAKVAQALACGLIPWTEVGATQGPRGLSRLHSLSSNLLALK